MKKILLISTMMLVLSAFGYADQKEVFTRIDAELQRLVKEDNFSGVVLISRNEQPLFTRSHGLANRTYKAPVAAETRFNIGSIGKSFTRFAIEKLIAEGKLKTTDTIGALLPDYPNKDAAEQVTISHLLEMKSGIVDVFGDKFEATPKDRIRSLQDYRALFADQPLLFAPGTQKKYSNGGYIVLGLIIEKITGRNYYEYIRKTIFEPNGMQNTGFYSPDDLPANTATGYTAMTSEDQIRRSNIYTLPGRGSSAGGVYSTAADLLKFISVLRNSGPRKSEGAPFAIGMGGGAPGVNAMLEVLENGYSIIVLSNYDPPAAEAPAKSFSEWLSKLP